MPHRCFAVRTGRWCSAPPADRWATWPRRGRRFRPAEFERHFSRDWRHLQSDRGGPDRLRAAVRAAAHEDHSREGRPARDAPNRRGDRGSPAISGIRCVVSCVRLVGIGGRIYSEVSAIEDQPSPRPRAVGLPFFFNVIITIFRGDRRGGLRLGPADATPPAGGVAPARSRALSARHRSLVFAPEQRPVAPKSTHR